MFARRLPRLRSAAFFLALGACAQGAGIGGTGGAGGTGGTGGAGGFLSTFSRAKAPVSTRLAGGVIKVVGPAGFCIEKSTRLTSGDGGFVVLGQCASISGNPNDAKAVVPAVLTVSVLPVTDAASVTLPALKAHFASQAGRAALAASGRAEDAQVLRARISDNALVLRVKDSSAPRPEQLTREYWRGLFTANGYLISLTVTGLDGYPMTPRTEQRLLGAFLRAMRAANPERENRGIGGLSLFNRLL